MTEHPREPELQALHAADQWARRFADRCYRTGWIIVAAAFVGILVAKIILGPALVHTTLFLFGLAFLALLGLGASLLGSGGVDRGFRPQRSMTLRLLAQAEDNERRMARMEAAIERIAELLPEDQKRQEWLGFNAAFRHGFVQDELTGTDGHPKARGRGHLELAPRPVASDQQP